MLVENIEENSIKGQRLLFDFMVSKNVTIHEFIIHKELIYKTAMDGARANALIESHGEIFIDEIADVKRSKVALKSCVTSLRKDADALFL